MVHVGTKQYRQHRKKLTLPKKKREWKAAKTSLLTAGWVKGSNPIDWDLRQQLETLRARSRNEAQNNDHVKHFLRLVRMNVAGPQGVRLQGRVKLRTGKADERANRAIEQSWKRWGENEPDVTGMKTWQLIQAEAVETVARDGEALYRKIRGWDNGFGFALEELDPALLDVTFNEDKGNRQIVLGVEINEWRRPVAYHFLKDRKSVYSGYQREVERIRIPAEDIYHLFLPEWVLQTRGVPWVATALERLHQVRGYEDAEVVAARVSAAKMGFYQKEASAGPYVGDDEDQNRNPIQEAAPGEFEILPDGYTFEGWDPQHPNSVYGEFVKAMMRGVASGLGVNYNSLANDLEGVNYTSLRHGMLTERDVWMMLQNWFIQRFCRRVYNDWLEEAITRGAISDDGRPIPVRRVDDLRNVYWQPRRWAWVDPLKESKAHETDYKLRKRSITSMIVEEGRDPDEVWEEMAREKERMAELGIDMPNSQPQGDKDEDLDDETVNGQDSKA